ncbi:hypothetical protein PIB30_003149 [Stylosanthes scabra]|uniref:Ubiquitin-like protease family profile domain-containing protein n=1 Tax=Stylosanthes scabra TaxID=79078 RepID=A0ABU6Z3Z5_9FABA|nr:hypothetical protein [Stylosanthes scabra]
MERRVAVWGTIPKGDNEWLPVFKLKGDKHLEALRYQFKSMAQKNYVDIQVVSILCHILNRTPGERYQNLIYCVPPEILQRMFERFEHKWRDGKKKKPHEISELLNIDEYLGFLEKDGLIGRRFVSNFRFEKLSFPLFAPVLFSEHWWLYVLDVEKKHLFVLDSKNVVSPTTERTEMGKFASNILDQLLTWAGREVNEIRLIRPGAALRSPFIQLDSADLKSD